MYIRVREASRSLWGALCEGKRIQRLPPVSPHLAWHLEWKRCRETARWMGGVAGGAGWAHGGRRRGRWWMVDDGRMRGRVGSGVDGGVGGRGHGCALRGATVDTVVSRSQLTLSPVVWPSHR